MWIQFGSFWIYPLLSVILLNLACRAEPSRGLQELAWWSLVGLFFWTLLEYLIHRSLHWTSGNPKLDGLLEKIHLYHHADPRHPARILVCPIYTLPISAAVFGLFQLLTGSFFSTTAFMTGTWAGFLYYEFVHYRVHLSSASGGLLRYQRRRHFYHHFVDGNYCFGVTSPLWDFVFGTFRRLPGRR